MGGLVSNDIFGEAAVLEPFRSVAEGSVVTDTNVEVLCIHKTVLQRYPYTCTDQFRSGVRLKSIIYPRDNKLVMNLNDAEAWLGFREETMKSISKTRWPVSKRRIREVRGGTVIMDDLETKFTKDNV